MKQPRAICAMCNWCIIKPETSMTKVTRLDFRCMAVRHEKIIDPVTGREMHVTHEANIMTGEEHPNCIDMNPNGECAMYELAPEVE